MKTENFDDAIRRKVESIHHSFNEEDIDRVHDFVSSSKVPVSFWKAYGFGSVIATSVLVISGLMFWNIKQMQEQKVLISKIETLEKNEILLKATQAEILKNEAAITFQKADPGENGVQLNTAEASIKKSINTVNSNKIANRPLVKDGSTSKKSTIASAQIASEDYDHQVGSAKKYQAENVSGVKHKSNRNKVKSTIAETDDLQNETANSFEEAPSDATPPLALNSTETKSTLTQDHTNEKISALNQTKKTEEKTSSETDNANSEELVLVDPKTMDNSDVTLSKEVKGKKVLNAANVQKTKARNVSPPINNKAEKSNLMAIREPKPAIERSAKVKRSKRSPEIAVYNETNVLFKTNKKTADPNNAESVAAKKDTVAENPEKIVALNNAAFPDSVASSAEQKNELPLLKPLIQFQLGVGLEKTKDQGGGAILGEIILNKRFGLSIGMKLLSTNNEKYDDLNDYHRQRNRYINEFNTFSDTSISNIGVANTVFQLPIAFTYYQPLKRNFSLLFSLGTDIDLFSKQNLKYQYHTGVLNDPDRHEDFDIKRTNFMFNNVVLSAGLQKQWKHFVFQASPYISPQIRPVDYKNDKINIGFRVRAFYRF